MKRHERERLTELLSSRIDRRFCPHDPFPKQQIFLSIDDEEALYGGAAGGGKSDALLMAFLQYVDQPDYHGLILRRKSVDLERSDAILARAASWWLPTSRTGVYYSAKKKQFTFPSGATCTFGHANNVGDEVENYQGGQWQFFGFDELTQFAPSQYLYLFSRRRRTNEAIPLRTRATANPGGPGHAFVRDRFMSLEFAKLFLAGKAPPTYSRKVIFDDTEIGERYESVRHFVPAKSQDNLALDVKSYRRGLSNLDVVTRGQLMDGNWLISSAGRFKPEWFRRYESPLYNPRLGGYYRVLNDDESVWKIYHQETDCYRFIVVDPAGTEKEIADKKDHGREPWSVISTFDLTTRDSFMFWRRVDRLQGEFPEVCDKIVDVWRAEKAQAVFVERDGIGRPYAQMLAKKGIPVVGIDTGGRDKLVRAAAATNEAKEGRIFLPTYAPWLPALEAELFTWTGIKGELVDQIDTLAYAAQLKVDEQLVGSMIMQL